MKNHTEIINALDEALKVKDNFDIIKRELLVQDKKLVFYCVDGFVKDEVLEKMMEFILKADLASMENNGLQVLANQLVSYVETDVSKDFQQMITAVLSECKSRRMIEYFAEAETDSWKLWYLIPH